MFLIFKRYLWFSWRALTNEVSSITGPGIFSLHKNFDIFSPELRPVESYSGRSSSISWNSTSPHSLTTPGVIFHPQERSVCEGKDVNQWRQSGWKTWRQMMSTQGWLFFTAKTFGNQTFWGFKVSFFNLEWQVKLCRSTCWNYTIDLDLLCFLLSSKQFQRVYQNLESWT